MANLKILHVDLETGKIVANANSGSGGPSLTDFVLKAGDTMTGYLELHDNPIDPLHATPKQYVDVLIGDVLDEISDLQDAHDNDLTNYVNKSGDTMSGYLELHADPISNMQPTTKQYVDTNALFKTGGTITGYLQLDNTPVLGSHAATKQYVDDAILLGGGNPPSGSYLPLTGGTMTGAIELHDDPTFPLQAATKQYVDNVATGLDVKESVRIGTTVDITLAGIQLIDGVGISDGDRILVKEQTNAAENGIYVVALGTWSRSEDADGTPVNEVTSGMFTFIEEGDTLANTGWVLTTNNPIILDTTPLQFSKFSATGEYLLKSGDTMTGPLILNGSPTQTQEAATKGYTDNLIQNIGDKYEQGTPSSTWTITHNRNTTQILVQVFEGNETVIPDRITIIDADTIEVSFGAPVMGTANMVFFG